MNCEAHRWRIAEPEGKVSLGTCKNCGAEKSFKNGFETEDLSDNDRLQMMMTMPREGWLEENSSLGSISRLLTREILGEEVE